MVFDCPEEQHVEGKYARELFYIMFSYSPTAIKSHCLSDQNRFILKPIELKVSSISGPISRGG